ncbi:biosynthetic-type acetolactate synthase large subunit [Roseivirga pacifica]|uniref:biosynthetic-type acetolactate synthase large subunit n=1 Tax=Roseivirga pacifica TaxID=1267423 RepID=UPI002094CC23|nr:biosynthetic-type acetolactate synthase large subunit [Roseivirga pacifica]MCO6361012.1 biosynthetic-type acetolactate synthase large subunit [Roseivirga pacifica]MCO6368901.1 biosynthetic-type acetolactate synthase large subunit [Roseivirga pacifica]MCO6373044.1 biosynthetic-type acetolactate synthase large subunit [Roseivirga pacifica]MCO6373124.1 biosynthetic-type acetolactate synthase large subunit [Roseivirga pacifica]MCO6377619.1 biosynthetic-type acetolactate synthase large subunit [
MEAVLTKPTAQKVKTSGADAVLRSLVAEEASLVFGYPGGAIMPVYDALYHYQEQIKHVLTRHEQGAIHAAQGYARATGEVGVVMATSGPGATNLITGIADAMIDSTPLVCITGQVASPLLGTDAFQETDIISISMPVTKWNIQVTKAEEIPGAIAKAFYIAKSGRPGPVLIDITKDAQFNELEFEYEKCEVIRSYRPVPEVDSSQVAKAAELINQAKKPFVLFGQGVILGEAEAEFKAFIEKAGLPSAWTLLGLSALPTEHPLNVGMLGMHGNYGPNKLTNECDVLIAVGMRFDDRVTGKLSEYAKQAKVVHLDIDPAEISKNVKVDAPVLGNCKESLTQLTALINRNSHLEWLERFRELDLIEQNQVINEELNPNSEALTMGEVINRINKETDGDAVLVTDVGQHQMVACRYTQFKQTKSNITSGGLGTMGFCLPAAIGAKLGVPNREVIAVIGDGGFQMTIQELGTIFQTEAAVKIVVLNNSFLGMVRQWQQLFFDKRYSSTELVNPDFVRIAEGYGIKGKSIDSRDDLDGAIKEMIAHEGSYLLEVHVGKEDNVFPMVPTGASVSDVRLS